MTDVTEWSDVESHPALSRGEVHLWRIPLRVESEPHGARTAQASVVSNVEREGSSHPSFDAEPGAARTSARLRLVADFARLLSTDERERMMRFSAGEHRDRFVLRRGALRVLLGRYLGIEAGDVQFLYASRGKPYVEESLHGARIEFSLSDSGVWALVGVTLGARIGVDVEHLRRPLSDADALARRFFSQREYEELQRLPESQVRTGFFNCWTRKEAWLKARGEGLAHSLKSFDVTLAPGEAPRLLEITDGKDDPRRWSLYTCIPDIDYVGAVAVETELEAAPVRVLSLTLRSQTLRAEGP